jgi:hypothetical protein
LLFFRILAFPAIRSSIPKKASPLIRVVRVPLSLLFSTVITVPTGIGVSSRSLLRRLNSFVEIIVVGKTTESSVVISRNSCEDRGYLSWIA